MFGALVYLPSSFWYISCMNTTDSGSLRLWPPVYGCVRVTHMSPSKILCCHRPRRIWPRLELLRMSVTAWTESRSLINVHIQSCPKYVIFLRNECGLDWTSLVVAEICVGYEWNRLKSLGPIQEWMMAWRYRHVDIINFFKSAAYCMF